MKAFDEFKMTFDYAMARNEAMAFGCRCTVQYSGRIGSYLPQGDRIFIVKQDKTLLIHQPTGSNPVNHMRQDSTHELIRAERSLIFKSRNHPHDEHLDATIDKIHFFGSYPLHDSQSLQLQGTEQDMADMIMKDPSLISRYFKPLSKEEHTRHGSIDVIGYEDKVLTIIGCRCSAGDPKAVDQLRRTVEAVKKSKGLEHVQGILACPSVTPKAEILLADLGLGFVKLEPPSYLERYQKKQSRLDAF